MKTIDIKGNAYVEVKERVKHFRGNDNYKSWSIQTEMLSNESGTCIFRASIYNDKERLISTGHAYEKEGAGMVNKTSYIENCETSAVGRALGNLGIGIDAAIASADEMRNQPEPITEDQALEIEGMIKDLKEKEKPWLDWIGGDSSLAILTIRDIPAKKYKQMITALKARAK